MNVPYTAPTSMTAVANTARADRAGRRDRAVPVAARPGSIAKTTQLHAVNVAARPATAANRKPNPNPFSAKLPPNVDESPSVRPVTTLRPKPSTSLGFQNPATSRPMQTAAAIQARRLVRPYATGSSDDDGTLSWSAGWAVTTEDSDIGIYLDDARRLAGRSRDARASGLAVRPVRRPVIRATRPWSANRPSPHGTSREAGFLEGLRTAWSPRERD